MVQLAASLCGRVARHNKQSVHQAFCNAGATLPSVRTMVDIQAICCAAPHPFDCLATRSPWLHGQRSHDPGVKNPARRSGAPDKSDQLSRAGGPSQGEVPGRERGIADNRYEIPGVGGESAERIIAPAAQGKGELVHRAHPRKRKAGGPGSPNSAARSTP